MKNLKILLMAFAITMGIGGAFAHQYSMKTKSSGPNDYVSPISGLSPGDSRLVLWSDKDLAAGGWTCDEAELVHCVYGYNSATNRYDKDLWAFPNNIYGQFITY